MLKIQTEQSYLHLLLPNLTNFKVWDFKVGLFWEEIIEILFKIFFVSSFDKEKIFSEIKNEKIKVFISWKILLYLL